MREHRHIPRPAPWLQHTSHLFDGSNAIYRGTFPPELSRCISRQVAPLSSIRQTLIVFDASPRVHEYKNLPSSLITTSHAVSPFVLTPLSSVDTTLFSAQLHRRTARPHAPVVQIDRAVHLMNAINKIPIRMKRHMPRP